MQSRPILNLFRAFHFFKPADEFDQELLLEIIQVHATVLRRMFVVQSLLVLCIAGLVIPYVNSVIFWTWGGLSFMHEYSRGQYAKKILRLGSDLNLASTYKICIIAAAISGAFHGLAALLFMGKLPLSDQALMSIILFAIPACGVSVAVSSRSILFGHSILVLMPTTYSWITLHPEHTFTASISTLLYWGFIMASADDGEQLLYRSVVIRQERDRMVVDLQHSIAEVHAAVTKAEHASQARARVLAAASHDLRQPLHALSVYSAVLATSPKPESLPEVAQNIDRLVRSLGSLLHGLLDLSRLSADYYRPENQFFCLNLVIENVCNEFEGAITEKNLTLVKDLPNVYLRDDALAIARITRNLLDNAIKYTESGLIMVRLETSHHSVRLIVQDSGAGIPAEEQRRIFEEFYQLDNPGRDYSKGVGLGLAIVQRLCELINAQIAIESTPGKGSMFAVNFNSLVNEYIEPESDNNLNFKTIHNSTIFVVDDEIDILESSKSLLEIWNVIVKTALSAVAVEALFEQYGVPDLLIVDLRLREKENGAELAQRLQKQYGNFPVLVITGETASAALVKTNMAGYPILQKPINPEVLFTALCKVVSPKRRLIIPTAD